ncbi:MAG: IS30 family transposase, partial [Solirubrobacteraceae bacterium]
MAQIGRPGLSVQQKKDLWKRWKEGQSLSDIGRALGKHPASIHGVVKANGGIVAAERTRSLRVLSLAEREEISRGLARHDSVRRIASDIGRAPSTVSREINRHGGRRRYRAVGADDRAWRSAKRPKLCLLAVNLPLQQLVAGKLADDWSPEQISGWLVASFPDDDTLRVSPETIYRSLFLQARGVLRKELISHLRRVRTMRSSKHATRRGQNRGGITDAVSIRERPAEIEDRAIPGHWEGDLIRGRANTYIATLVERHSRFVMLVKVDGKDTESVVDALTRQVGQLPDELMRSLTWDRGTELAAHQKFTIATDTKVYFCDPASPWQRGTNENTNGLLRQYFPKGTDLAAHSQIDLDDIALKLNTRPRKTLGFTTPASKLEHTVA